jgi:hypothetical protein
MVHTNRESERFAWTRHMAGPSARSARRRRRALRPRGSGGRPQVSTAHTAGARRSVHPSDSARTGQRIRLLRSGKRRLGSISCVDVCPDRSSLASRLPDTATPHFRTSPVPSSSATTRWRAPPFKSWTRPTNARTSGAGSRNNSARQLSRQASAPIQVQTARISVEFAT